MLEAGEDGKTEKVTPSERMDRRNIMQKEFKEHNPGMLEREKCPGVRCEDLFYDFMYLNRIREYPHPEQCTSEDQECEAEEMRKRKCRYDNPEDEKKGSTDDQCARSIAGSIFCMPSPGGRSHATCLP